MCEENGHTSQLSPLIVVQSQTDLPRLTTHIDTYTLKIETYKHTNLNEMYKRKPNVLFGCVKNFRVIEITSRYCAGGSTASTRVFRRYQTPNTIQMKYTHILKYNL